MCKYTILILFCGEIVARQYTFVSRNQPKAEINYHDTFIQRGVAKRYLYK